MCKRKSFIKLEVQDISRILVTRRQSCPWVGLNHGSGWGEFFFHFLVRLVELTHGLGWVGSGWVEIFHVLVRWVNPSVGLGWVEIFFYFLVGWVGL